MEKLTAISSHVEVTGTGEQSKPVNLAYKVDKNTYTKFKNSSYARLSGAFYLKVIEFEQSFIDCDIKTDKDSDKFETTIQFFSSKGETQQTASLNITGWCSYVKDKDEYYIWIDIISTVKSFKCDELAEITFDIDMIDFINK